jgi:hypothetical protein
MPGAPAAPGRTPGQPRIDRSDLAGSRSCERPRGTPAPRGPAAAVRSFTPP